MISINGGFALVALEADSLAAATIRDAAGESNISPVSIVADLATLIRTVESEKPALVILDLAQIGPDPAASVRSVLGAAPESCVIVTGADAPPRLISRAVSAGARAFLLRPFTSLELAATLRDTHRDFAEIRRLQRGDAPRDSARGTLIAVYSPKGGVGCTTIATNLAVALASRNRRRVALVDLDLQFGDVGVALDVRTANSIVDLVAHTEDADDAMLQDIFVRHASGVRVLAAPDNIAAVESVDPERIVRALDMLRDHFDVIICDLWSSLDELTLATLKIADRIVLVSTPELPSLKNLRRVIAATAPLLGDERTQIVLNRHPGKAGVSIADVEKNLGREVSATIASEGIGITEAINQGISFFDSRAKVRVSRSYLKLADAVVSEPAKTPIAVVSSTVRA